MDYYGETGRKFHMARATTIDTSQIAKLLDITPRHVQRLTMEGVLERARDVDGSELRGRYELVRSVHGYIKLLREQAHYDDASESTRARLVNQKLTAEAQTADIRLQQLKGEVLKSTDVEFIVTNMITAVKAHMVSIPSRVARLLVGATSFQKIYDLLYTEIESALRELSDFRPAMFEAANRGYLTDQGADPTSLNGEADADAQGEDAEPA